jgi:hypothetical protein
VTFLHGDLYFQRAPRSLIVQWENGLQTLLQIAVQTRLPNKPERHQSMGIIYIVGRNDEENDKVFTNRLLYQLSYLGLINSP